MKNQSLLSILAIAFMLFVMIPVRPTSAAGTLQVNTASDTVASDNYLSLREAMEVAAGTLTGPFTLAERTQLSGCTFSAGGLITGGCGSGGDTIVFTPNLTEIVLTSRLPNIVKDGITVNGSVNAGNLIINANAAVDYGFNVNANNVILENLTIVNINSYGAAIGLANGSWKGLQVSNDYLGVLPTSTSCSDPAITSRPYFDIILFGGSGTSAAGDGTAYIDNNVIGCSQNEGVAISGAPYVYVGQTITGQTDGNLIGVTRNNGNIGNSGNGISVCCTLGTTGNQILNNRIGFNTLDGILLQDVTTTTVNSNEIFHNSGAGIRVLNTSGTTMNDDISHDNDSSGVWFTQDAPTPLMTTDNHILGGAYYHNGIAGISEGEGADANSWEEISTFQNAGLGVDKLDNGVPDLPSLTLTSVEPSSPGVVVFGNLGGSIGFFIDYHIELYRAMPDPTGSGEGIQYLGYTDLFWNAYSDYSWSIPVPSGAGCAYTAVLTAIDPTSSTSTEFSTNLTIPCTSDFVPLISK